MNVLNVLHPARAAGRRHVCTDCRRTADPGRQGLARGEVLPRHWHSQPFAAVVLSGGYVEAGDSGLHRVQAGSVLFHESFEHHLNRVDRNGAELLLLPLSDDWSAAHHGCVTDVDVIARQSEHDLSAAVTELLTQTRFAPRAQHDWPAELAAALLADPNLSLWQWAHDHGMHPGSVSRGFRQVFAVSPKAFRLQARTHAALRLYRGSSLTASAIAHTCGFADQGHLSRSITAMTGANPSKLRRQATIRS